MEYNVAVHVANSGCFSCFRHFFLCDSSNRLIKVVCHV